MEPLKKTGAGSVRNTTADDPNLLCLQNLLPIESVIRNDREAEKKAWLQVQEENENRNSPCLNLDEVLPRNLNGKIYVIMVGYGRTPLFFNVPQQVHGVEVVFIPGYSYITGISRLTRFTNGFGPMFDAEGILLAFRSAFQLPPDALGYVILNSHHFPVHYNKVKKAFFFSRNLGGGIFSPYGVLQDDNTRGSSSLFLKAFEKMVTMCLIANVGKEIEVSKIPCKNPRCINSSSWKMNYRSQCFICETCAAKLKNLDVEGAKERLQKPYIPSVRKWKPAELNGLRKYVSSAQKNIAELAEAMYPEECKALCGPPHARDKEKLKKFLEERIPTLPMKVAPWGLRLVNPKDAASAIPDEFFSIDMQKRSD